MVMMMMWQGDHYFAMINDGDLMISFYCITSKTPLHIITVSAKLNHYIMSRVIKIDMRIAELFYCHFC